MNEALTSEPRAASISAWVLTSPDATKIGPILDRTAICAAPGTGSTPRFVRSLMHPAGHGGVEAGLLRQDRRGLVRVCLRPGPRLLVGVDDGLREVGLVLDERLRRVEEPVTVERDVPIEQLGAGLLGAGHDRIEPGPRIDRAVLQRRPAIGVLEDLDRHVGRLQTGRLERLEQEEVRVGALGGGDLLALEVRDRRDRRPLRDDDGGPLRLREDVDDLDRRAVGTSEERRGPRRRADVDRVRAQCLVGLVRAGRLDPVDASRSGLPGPIRASPCP